MEKNDKELIKNKIKDLEEQVVRSTRWKRELELEIEALKRFEGGY